MAHLCPVCEEYCTCDCDDVFWYEDQYVGPCYHHEEFKCGEDDDNDEGFYWLDEPKTEETK